MIIKLHKNFSIHLKKKLFIIENLWSPHRMTICQKDLMPAYQKAYCQYNSSAWSMDCLLLSFYTLSHFIVSILSSRTGPSL